MRRYFGWVLLGLMIIPFAATFLWFKAEQHAVKKHVKRHIMQHTQKDELLEFTFLHNDTAQLNWKHSREFEWQGEMYDIIYRSHIDGVITYHVWHDSEETQLNNQINRMYHAMFFQQKDSSSQDICFQLILKGWMCESFDHPITSSNFKYPLRHLFHYVPHFSVPYIGFIDHPPLV